MTDERSANPVFPRGIVRNASPDEPAPADSEEHYRVRHLIGFAVGALLALYPVAKSLQIYDALTNGGHGGPMNGILIVLARFVPFLLDAAQVVEKPFMGVKVCGLCVVIAVPLLAVALAVFLTGWVLTVEEIKTQHRRLCAGEQPDQGPLART